MHERFKLPNQLPGEKTIQVLHRHWFVMVRHLIQVLVLGLLPFLIVLVVIQFTEFTLTTGTFSYVLLVMGMSLYFLYLLLLLYGYWLDYALDVFIITDKRVIDVEQAGLFNRTVAEQRLYRVQDVTYEVKGVIRTFLKYGDVHVQTAGERQRFVFEDVPHPDRVTEVILRQVDRIRKEGSQDLSDPDAVMQGSQPSGKRAPKPLDQGPAA